jgi:ppGpp synthetase/RelA/SpoT-type nucleotidyltranferase
MENNIHGPSNDYLALRLEHDSQSALNKILDALRGVGIIDEAYAIKARVKTEQKLVEKLQRKQKVKSGYTLADITDVIGVRIVSLFREDMIELFRKLVELIDHSHKINPNPFLKNAFDEVIIYSQSQHDPLTANIKLLSHSLLHGMEVQHAISLEGYSSIHLVCRVDQTVALDNGPVNIPVEFQIRTVFEDAWGEIDHKFRYSSVEGKQSIEIKNPSAVSENLKILKKFSDACSLYADEIRNYAIDDEQQPFASFSTHPVDTGDVIHEHLESIGVSEEYLDKYLILRQELIRQTKDKERTENLKLVTAADAFLDLAKGMSKDTKDVNDAMYIDYHLSMHAALCLLATAESKNLRIALDIYKTLHDQHQGNPMICFRMAQTFVGLRLIDEALEVYSSLKVEEVDKSLSDLLHTKEVQHIKQYLPFAHGYVLWRQSTELEEKTSKLQKIKQAIEVTENGLQYVTDESFKSAYKNNLLYYRYELAVNSDDSDSENDRTLRALIDDVIANNSRLESDLFVLDSLVKAHYALSEYEKCIVYADKLIDISLTSQDKKRSRDTVWRLTQNAHEMKKSATNSLTSVQ